ncbi:MAG: hypothetical protein ACRCYU_03220, partial [Nocardioides sp.]
MDSKEPPSPQRDVLQGGPTRASWLHRLTPASRQRGVILLAVAFGVVGGGGAVWWWNDRPQTEVRSSSPPTVGSTDVRLVLSEVVGPALPTDQKGAEAAPLRIEGALLHDRVSGSATVTRIHRPGQALAIRVPALPVRLSVNHSFERIRLQVLPR